MPTPLPIIDKLPTPTLHMPRPLTSIQFSLRSHLIPLLQAQGRPEESLSITAKRLLVDLLNGSLPTPTLSTPTLPTPTLPTPTLPTPTLPTDYQEKIQELESKVSALEDKLQQFTEDDEVYRRIVALEVRVEDLATSKDSDPLAQYQAALEERLNEKFTRLELWIKKVESLTLATPREAAPLPEPTGEKPLEALTIHEVLERLTEKWKGHPDQEKAYYVLDQIELKVADDINVGVVYESLVGRYRKDLEMLDQGVIPKTTGELISRKRPGRPPKALKNTP